MGCEGLGRRAPNTGWRREMPPGAHPPRRRTQKVGDVLVGDHHAKEIKPGYVFDACVLPDLKSGSECYALAVARYNTISVSL